MLFPEKNVLSSRHIKGAINYPNEAINNVCSDIARWKDKKESERANAAYNEILYFGLEEEP